MTGNYEATIPAYHGLNNANAAALDPVRALEDVTNAREETMAARKKRKQTANVTDDDKLVSRALVVRETAVAREVSAPAWATLLLRVPDQITNLETRLETRMGRLETRMDRLETQTAGLQAQIASPAKQQDCQ